ncbi:MAG: hypothetical protein M1837_002690 [Sclerophora amabilis]|nr:MAG: hypothetical protein M1837_002690 [Sclerophora amabilis]
MSQRGNTPERMLGMTDGQDGPGRFISANDVSDSSEEEMDVESQSDGVEEGPNEPLPKRQAREADFGNRNVAAPVPQWSNPDPYTVLPPPDESQRKRKDVVKLIRKARVSANKAEELKDSATSNDDFISLDIQDDADDQLDDDDEESVASATRSVPVAPSGPRSIYGRNMYQDHSHLNAPGTNGGTGSADSVGPPPTLAAARPVPVDIWPPPTTDAALGNRKRTHDDEIKDHPPQRQRKSNKPGTGQVVDHWRPRNPRLSTPWCDVDHHKTENMGFWLHKEIRDFYEYVRPRHFEDTIRNDLVHRLQKVVAMAYPKCDIRSFGSFAAGLYLPNADMDLVMVSESYMTSHYRSLGVSRSFYFQFARFLERHRIPEPGSIEIIAKAKVPLVKFVDRVTGLRVDMSFENDTGLVANQTFQKWKVQYPAMPILVTILKQFLAMRALNEVVSGGLGGFSVTCLVTSLLQNMPQVQSGNMLPEHHLGEILMEFLDLYGNEFNVRTTGIQLDPPGYFEKPFNRNMPYNKNNKQRLSIIDPNRPDNDISGGTSNIDTIMRCFSEAYETLQSRLGDLNFAELERRKGASILGTILAGDYAQFETQRNRLRELYEQSFDGNSTLPVSSILEATHEQVVFQEQTSDGIAMGDPRTSHAIEVREISEINSEFPDISSAASCLARLTQNKDIVRPQSSHAEGKENDGPSDQSVTALSHEIVEEQDRARAERFKREYPQIPDIPDRIKLSHMRDMIKKFKKRQGGAANTKKPQTKRQARKEERKENKETADRFRQRFPEIGNVPKRMNSDKVEAMMKHAFGEHSDVEAMITDFHASEKTEVNRKVPSNFRGVHNKTEKRAKRLQEEYPGMSNIPKEISHPQREVLIRKFNRKNGKREKKKEREGGTAKTHKIETRSQTENKRKEADNREAKQRAKSFRKAFPEIPNIPKRIKSPEVVAMIREYDKVHRKGRRKKHQDDEKPDRGAELEEGAAFDVPIEID